MQKIRNAYNLEYCMRWVTHEERKLVSINKSISGKMKLGSGNSSLWPHLIKVDLGFGCRATLFFPSST